MSKPANAPAEKSAADILIEMQLEEQRRKAINPLAYTKEEPKKGDRNEAGRPVAAVKVFANGAVLKSYK